MPGWVAGEEKATLLGAAAQLALTSRWAIRGHGRGGDHRAAGLFPHARRAEGRPAAVAGKIAFIDHAMAAGWLGLWPLWQMRGGRGRAGRVQGGRRCVIRSIGTDHNRDPHTGVTCGPRGGPIPQPPSPRPMRI
jgi:hypothetical protein